jgi:hypothetical protein
MVSDIHLINSLWVFEMQEPHKIEPLLLACENMSIAICDNGHAFRMSHPLHCCWRNHDRHGDLESKYSGA